MRSMVREAHGAPYEFTGNTATDYGTVNEINAEMAYENKTGNSVKECGFYPYDDWLGASPDGLIGDTGVVEFKAPYSLRNGGKYKTLEEQPHYHAQAQIEMLCAKRLWCDFVQWSPVLPLYIERVFLSYAWLFENLSKLRAFHDKFLIELDNPEHLEPLRKEVTTLAAHQLADEYDDLKDAIDRAKARQSDIIHELQLHSGGRNANIGDYKLTKIDKKGSVSYTKVVKQHCPDVDLAEYTGKPSEYWTLK